MKPIAVFYATREGQTEKIAGHMAETFRAVSLQAEVKNVKDLTRSSGLLEYSAVVLAASVHGGRHEREMERFVKDHLAELERLPSAFVSVTLSEASAEQSDAGPELRSTARADVERMIEAFFRKTGWHPKRVQPVAGALRYSKYNPFIRFVMKRIAKNAGRSTDTSHDTEYTNWVALDQWVGQLAEEFARSAEAPSFTSNYAST